MYTHNAIPGLTEAFSDRINQWRNQEPLSNLHFLDDSVGSIIVGQDEIGWGAMMFGSVHKAWSKEQRNYLTALGCCTTGNTWTSQLIRL